MPEIILNGPAGRLEARYLPSPDPKAPVAIILHPHPRHGGSMNNKVTYLTYQSFVEKGFTVLRFNFRGVGKSEGTYDEGEGELSDAAAIIDWFQTFRPNARSFWVAGFSFGAWIGMQLLMRRPEIRGFISIAPPANLYDFSFLAPCPVSGLVVHGSLDDVVPPESVSLLLQRLSRQKGITITHEVIEGAGHFFKSQLTALSEVLLTYLDSAEEREKEPFQYLEKKAGAGLPQGEELEADSLLLDEDEEEEYEDDYVKEAVVA